jgi:spermidine synthase
MERRPGIRRPLITMPGTGAHMIARFEELDWQETRMGELTLRRRADPATEELIYEVKLKDEYLMSSLFTAAEEELARLGLAKAQGVGLAVLVGGLGLGYTAATALQDDRVRRLDVIDALPAVIGWHERELLPVSAQLVTDSRTTLVHDDFFAVVRQPPASEDARYDVILLDVDHSPRHTLDPSHADLYTAVGLKSLAGHLNDGGVFALWSDDPPDADFITTLSSVFDGAAAHVVEFANRLTGGTSSNTVYVATRR